MGLKGRISIDAESGPLGNVLWCCGSRNWEVFTFFRLALAILWWESAVGHYPINNYLAVNIGRPNYVQISNVRLKLDYLKSWFYILNICNNLFELLYEFLKCGFSLSLLFQTLSYRHDMFLGCEMFGVFFLLSFPQNERKIY